MTCLPSTLRERTAFSISVAARDVLDLDDLDRVGYLEPLADLEDHPLGGADDEDLAEALALQGAGDLVAVGLVVEEGRLDGGHVQLLLLRGAAGEEGVAADEEAVVDDHVDAVFLRDELGAEALSGAALADEGIDADSLDEPEDAAEGAEHLG